MGENLRGDHIMDVSKILIELRQQRERLEEAILSLERLERGSGKRRGRPAGSGKNAEASAAS